MRAYGLTNVGLKRTMNQDAFYLDHEEALCIVADGMGGHKAGDLASRLALDSILDYITSGHKESQKCVDEETLLLSERDLCMEAVEYANDVVYEKASESAELHGMGTTLVLLRILNGHAILAHVGDSRIYRIQDEVITQLTKDHSRIQELIDQEQITREEAYKYPLKNVITRALGGAAEVKVDTAIIPLQRSDVFVLCTDGLSGVLEDDEILELVSANPGDPEESCRRLVQCTLDRGAPDNVTVIVTDTRAYCGGEPLDQPQGETPGVDDDKGAFRRFIDRWFNGS